MPYMDIKDELIEANKRLANAIEIMQKKNLMLEEKIKQLENELAKFNNEEKEPVIELEDKFKFYTKFDKKFIYTARKDYDEEQYFVMWQENGELECCIYTVDEVKDSFAKGIWFKV